MKPIFSRFKGEKHLILIVESNGSYHYESNIFDRSFEAAMFAHRNKQAERNILCQLYDINDTAETLVSTVIGDALSRDAMNPGAVRDEILSTIYRK